MKPHPLTLRQLQYVVSVADSGRFRRAAETCAVSQPSLSNQIRELEENLGVVLFERGSGPVLITPAGEELIARARRILLEADDLVIAARRLADPLSSPLRIGVIPTLSPYLLPELVEPLRKAMPKLMTLWLEERTERLLGDLRGGHIDAALLALVPGLEDLDTYVLGDESFLLAGQHGDPLLTPRRRARASDLDGARLLLLEDGHCFRDQVVAFCVGAHTDVIDFRGTSLATLAQMAAAGAGVTLLPELALPVENRLGSLSTRRFEAPIPSRRIALVWRKSSSVSSVLHEVARALRQRVEALLSGVRTTGRPSGLR